MYSSVPPLPVLALYNWRDHEVWLSDMDEELLQSPASCLEFVVYGREAVDVENTFVIGECSVMLSRLVQDSVKELNLPLEGASGGGAHVGSHISPLGSGRLGPPVRCKNGENGVSKPLLCF